MGSLRLGVSTATIALCFFACGGDPEHPPNLPAGGDGGSGLVTGGGSGGTGAGGTGGSTPCDPDPTLGTEVQGNLIVYDAQLLTKEPFAGRATLVMEGSPCGWAVGGYDGTATPPANFVLQGVKPLAQNWIHIYQDDTTTEDVKTTLLAVLTTSDLTLTDEFAFVRNTDIEALYASAGVERDPTKGTVLVQVVEAFGLTKTPKADAIVSTLGAAQIAYASGGSWSLGAGPTDASGMAALVNAEAEDFPGKSISVHMESAGVAYDFTAPVETDAVSILTFYTSF